MTITDQPMLEIQNVSKRFSHFHLHNLSIQLDKGEILGLVGPNGAGKSTTLGLAMGFLQADAGKIRGLGFDIPRQAIPFKTQTAYVSEEMRLFGNADLTWHMTFIQKAFPNWDSNYAKLLLKKFELNPQQKIRELSLGQRIKSTLLLALARRPKLIVMDEPSTGLDPIARYELTEQLFNVMLDEENSVIFSSQHTQDVERISDRIAFIDQGKLIADQDKESYLEQWKRIDVTGPECIPTIEGIAFIKKTTAGYTVIANQFSQHILDALINSGYTILRTTALNLEEIFIHQVQHHRRDHPGEIHHA